ncbi:DMT family transporter [Intestinibacter sp.]
MENKKYIGHLSALLTIIIWGTTFISTKILLKDFAPIEILVFRFIMGFVILFAICPKRLNTKDWKQEVTFMGAGLCGICLYYLLENIALTYTLASNVGVIISVAPFFTAILAHLFIKSEERLRVNFFIGFVIAIVGIIMISFNGAELQLNPMGDLLALLASFVWAVYSILSRKISGFGYPVVLSTRHTFFYGIIFMIPVSVLFDFNFDLTRFANPVNLANIIYLGFGASALCFVTWNFSVKKLGAVKTSIYIYMVPVITVVTSVLILHEQVTVMSALGVVFTLIGLIISELKFERNVKNELRK